MTLSPDTGTPEPKRRQKSPGRVAAMQRLNAEGKRGPGGRKPTHGLRALELMLQRGEEPPGQIGSLLATYEQAFLADLGGQENTSTMEQGLCRRLAELELLLGLVKARLITVQGGPRRLSWQQEKDLMFTHARLADAYAKGASTLGLKRRAKDPLAGELVIRRFADGPANGTAAQPAPDAAQKGA